MKYLLDTHAFLWFIGGHKKLSAKARSIIEDAGSDCLISAASIWEIAIKHSLGKIQSKVPLQTLIIDQVDENGFSILAISQQHAVRVALLDFHHRDPFDRMLVAQALVEDTGLLSADTALDDYGVRRVW